MNCKHCGKYEASEKAHELSITHLYNFLNATKLQYINRKTLRLDEQLSIIDQKNLLEEKLEDMKEMQLFNCGKCNHTEQTLESIIRHEKNCLNFDRAINPINEKKLKSNATATCDNCGKIYLHTSTLLPKYALARHMKSCKQNLKRNLRGKLNNMLIDADENLLQNVIQFIKQKQN